MWTRLRNLIAPPKPAPVEPPVAQWILVPLGNPGDDYAHTRHNLGRLMLQRWSAAHGRVPGHVHAFQTGTLYALGDPFLALVPATYMNLSGQVCAEAVAAGFDVGRMIVLYDDKDLPLGMGRFRLTGSPGGHNGMASVCDRLGTPNVARLRLGIGPYERPLHEYVLEAWTDEEWARIEALDAPFARFMERLDKADSLEALPGVVNASDFWS